MERGLQVIIRFRPLFGVCIVVTRAREQGGGLAQSLRDLGAEVLEAPTIRIADPADWAPVDRAIERIDTFDWVIFSSANGVERFFGRILSQGRDLRILKGVGLAAVGPATAQKVASYHLGVDLCPDRHVAEGVVGAFVEREEVSGRRFLVPRPETARDVVPVELRKMGGTVEDVVVYRTERPEALPRAAVERLEQGQVHMVTFTSPSTAKHFADLLGQERLEDVLRRVPAASIGPSTSRAAQELGFRVVAEPPPDEISVPGLVEAILAHFGGRP